MHVKLVQAIAQTRQGITREALLQKTGYKSGGTINKKLNELEASGFIERVAPFGHKKKDSLIRVVDEFVLFYMYWIDPIRNKRLPKDYWQSKAGNSGYDSWKGYAFEAVCFKHTDQIVRALGLERVAGELSSWRCQGNRSRKIQGAQIDLLIDRSDNAITLCEIKHHLSEYSINKNYAKQLANKMSVFEDKTNTTKQIFLCFISVYGVKRNIWSEDLVSGEVVLKDLYLP